MSEVDFQRDYKLALALLDKAANKNVAMRRALERICKTDVNTPGAAVRIQAYAVLALEEVAQND